MRTQMPALTSINRYLNQWRPVVAPTMRTTWPRRRKISMIMNGGGGLSALSHFICFAMRFVSELSGPSFETSPRSTLRGLLLTRLVFEAPRGKSPKLGCCSAPPGSTARGALERTVQIHAYVHGRYNLRNVYFLQAYDSKAVGTCRTTVFM